MQSRPIEDALRSELAELNESQRWIPVSTPPDDKVNYEVFGHGIFDCATYYKDHDAFYFEDGRFFPENFITHYRPLPQPPGGEE